MTTIYTPSLYDDWSADEETNQVIKNGGWVRDKKIDCVEYGNIDPDSHIYWTYSIGKHGENK